MHGQMELGVVVFHRTKVLIHADFRRKFFTYLTFQRFIWCFTYFHLPARELPPVFPIAISFFAKFIHGTENFCNFVGGNHERILLFYFTSDWYSDAKVQKISQITTNFLYDFLIPN